MFCFVRLIVGAILLLLSSTLSKSRSFYYVSAATLSAILGLLLVIFYVMKQSVSFIHVSCVECKLVIQRSDLLL